MNFKRPCTLNVSRRTCEETWFQSCFFTFMWLRLENAKEEKWDCVHENPPSLGGVLETSLFSTRGRGPVSLAVICLTLGSVGGQRQVERSSKTPPAQPELKATPSLHEACHEQNHQSLPGNDSFSRRVEGGGKQLACSTALPRKHRKSKCPVSKSQQP